MNNKNDNFFKKNASSIVICSSIAILLVATLYFSFNSLTQENNSDENLVTENTVDEESLFESVNKTDVKSYKENEKNNSNENNLNNSNNESTQNSQNSEEKINNSDSQSQNNSGNSNNSQNSSNTQTSNKEENPNENKENSQNKQTADATTFSLFDDTKEMLWPVSGQIVMDYSTETAIYDKTLDQYRTNDSISISAAEGTEVLAAAEGVVERVFADIEDGNTVVINHGNGWASTYSQLQDNILVDVGQVVNEGQVIGSVGTPSSYVSLLGSHLDFKITKDNVSTDPKLVLAQIEE